MPSKISNPFDKDEPLQDWFEGDVEFIMARNRTLKNFQASQNQSPTLQGGLRGFLYKLTHNAVFAVSLGLVVFTTLGVSAAQIFAPEGSRPSDIIGITKAKTEQVVEKDREKAIKPRSLISSEDYEVLVYPECDLALQYNKNLGELSYTVSASKGSFNFFDSKVTLDCSTNSSWNQIVAELDDFNLQEVESEDLPYLGALSKNLLTDKHESLKYYAYDENLQADVIQYLFQKNDNNIYILSVAENNPVAESEFIVQFNSLAPSQSSVDLKYIDAREQQIDGDTQEQESEDDTKEQETEEQSSVSPPRPQDRETYQNQYYPDLRINYDSSWNFSTSTEQSVYEGLVERKILLTKDDVTLRLTLEPKVVTGCFVPPDKNPNRAKSLDNGLARFTEGSGFFFYATDDGDTSSIDCAMLSIVTDTNIPSSTSLVSIYDQTASYSSFFPGDEFVKYTVQVVVYGNNQTVIEEADQILINSRF